MTNKSSDVQPANVRATCQYGFDGSGRYTCNLFEGTLTHPSDTLTITGTHVPGHGNADVLVVNHQSTVNRFHGDVLRTFVNLRILRIVNVRMSFIHENAFASCGQLQELNIMSNLVTSLPSQMLRNCVNLRTFDASLSDNLVTIPGDLFGTNRNLESFVVTAGNLVSFPTNLLENMSNLRVFNVSGNQILSISPNNFRTAQRIEEFGISFNEIIDGQSVMTILSAQPWLRRIRIMNNPFPMPNLNFFQQFQHLVDLAVGGGQGMTGINWQALPARLTSLGVTGIGEEISATAFNRMTNLTDLLLTGSGITTLPPNIFNGLKWLRRLLIMNTRLTTLHPQLFADLVSLRLLHLNFNQIEELPEGVFSNLGNLGYMEFLHGLFLMNNKLTSIPVNAFGAHPFLRQISFAGNEIDEIERGVFGRFNDVLDIDLRSNICINEAFTDARNLDQNRRLQTCFDNFAGIGTTTPGGSGRNFRVFEVFGIILIGFVGCLMK
ncbi:leucine-rich repeat-containing protein 15-like [Chironomus tepperi]|uniref:leucine-rich repeat-containing protein 15-like n=1 Tax=Chironomus tepperi TaxID=113505 RepID=UPI00391FA9FC